MRGRSLTPRSAGGRIGAEAAAKAPADGYTLLFGTIGAHGVGPALFRNLPFDPVKDFSPVGMLHKLPNLLVGASFPRRRLRGRAHRARQGAAGPADLRLRGTGIGIASFGRALQGRRRRRHRPRALQGRRRRGARSPVRHGVDDVRDHSQRHPACRLQGRPRKVTSTRTSTRCSGASTSTGATGATSGASARRASSRCRRSGAVA